MTPRTPEPISAYAAQRRDAILADASRSLRRYHGQRRAVIHALSAIPVIASALYVAHGPGSQAYNPNQRRTWGGIGLPPRSTQLQIRAEVLPTDPSALTRLAVATTPLPELSMTRVLDDDALMRSADEIAPFAGLIRARGRISVAFRVPPDASPSSEIIPGFDPSAHLNP